MYLFTRSCSLAPDTRSRSFFNRDTALLPWPSCSPFMRPLVSSSSSSLLSVVVLEVDDVVLDVEVEVDVDEVVDEVVDDVVDDVVE